MKQFDLKFGCHRNFEKMPLSDNGRFCGQCKTEVVDFTSMEPDEIKVYFQTGKAQCGRFNPDHIKTVKSGYQGPWQKASILLFLGLSFGTTAVGQNKTDDTLKVVTQEHPKQKENSTQEGSNGKDKKIRSAHYWDWKFPFRHKKRKYTSGLS